MTASNERQRKTRLGQIDVNDVAELLLGKVGDADLGFLHGLYPLMLAGVFKVGRECCGHREGDDQTPHSTETTNASGNVKSQRGGTVWTRTGEWTSSDHRNPTDRWARSSDLDHTARRQRALRYRLLAPRYGSCRERASTTHPEETGCAQHRHVKTQKGSRRTPAFPAPFTRLSRVRAARRRRRPVSHDSGR